jgi:acyl carrier protein
MKHEEIREFLKEYVFQKLKAQERDLPAEFSDDCDLLLSGLIDSMGVLEVVTALGEYCGADIDFEALDADQMTIVGPLCRFVSAQSAVR